MVEQVIWQNPLTGQRTGIGGGQINPGYYDPGTYAGHSDHVHTRQSTPIPLPFMKYDTGGELPPGLTIANNETGENEYILRRDQLQTIAGADPSQNRLAPGSVDAQQAIASQLGGQPEDAGMFGGERTQGYIPAGAGNAGVSGTSFLSGVYNMGAEVVNGVIDQAASMASSAAGAALAADNGCRRGRCASGGDDDDDDNSSVDRHGGASG